MSVLVFTENWDWRLTENPSDLSEIFKYITHSVSPSGAILDSWNNPVLDSLGNEILESP